MVPPERKKKASEDIILHKKMATPRRSFWVAMATDPTKVGKVDIEPTDIDLADVCKAIRVEFAQNLQHYDVIDLKLTTHDGLALEPDLLLTELLNERPDCGSSRATAFKVSTCMFLLFTYAI